MSISRDPKDDARREEVAHGQPETVFVVDDDEAMRDSLEFLLASIGLEVLSFKSAEAFLEAYDESRPGCLLTDLRMPGLSGLALHEELRRRGFAIPVVVMTAYADVPTAVRALRGGVVDFIEKPFTDQELLERLRNALALDRNRRAASRTPDSQERPSPATPIYPPDQVGQYRILSQLGSGGMSDVFLAEDMELHRHVALKFLQLHREDEARRIRFRQEARAVAALNHPNIVTIYQILEHGDRLCIAMEYVEGRTLREMIAARQIDVEGAVDIALQILEGLAEAHRAGIVHRDVKPENVIVDSRGRARLLDFGIAKRKQSPRITGENKMIGTPAYMSPEQAWGEDTSPQSDLFALGVVLYEMLVGVCPFLGKNPLRILKAILSDSPKPFPEERVDIPEVLRAVVLRALEKDLDLRYPDAESMKHDLLALCPTPTPTPTPVASTIAAVQPETPVWRRRLLGPVTVIVLVFIAVAALNLALRSPPSPAPTEDSTTAVAVLPFTVRGAEDLAYLDQGLVELLSLKLDGAGALRSVDPQALLGHYAQRRETASRLANGLEVAHRFGARYFTLGSVVGIGSEIHLDVALYDVEEPDAPEARAVAKGAPEDILEMLDEVAVQLLGGLAVGPGPRLRETAAATSDSLPAVKAYLLGEARFREGRYEEALEAFQKAVAQDPDFALAYYRLCSAADWVARGEISARAAAEAERLKDRLNDPDRLLLEALIAWRRGDAAEAERIYRTLLGTYPDDVEAWFRLGEVLFHYGPRQGRSLDDAQEAFDTVIDLEPDHVQALWHLARIAARRSEAEKLRRQVSRIRELQPSGDRLTEILALEAFALGGPEKRSQALKELRAARDLTLLITLWDVATFTPPGSSQEALRIAALVADPGRSPEMRALGHVAAAHLHLASGRWEEAKSFLDSAAEIDPSTGAEYRAGLLLHPWLSPTRGELTAALDGLSKIDSTAADNATSNVFLSVHKEGHDEIGLYLAGRLSLRLDEPEEAARRADQLEASGALLAQDLARGLRARIALGESDSETALALLEEVQKSNVWYGWTTVSPFFSRSSERFLLAETLAAVGRYEEALVLYGSFAEHSLFDLVYEAPSHARRAEIYEKLGRKDSAAHHEREFLRLWPEPIP